MAAPAVARCVLVARFHASATGRRQWHAGHPDPGVGCAGRVGFSERAGGGPATPPPPPKVKRPRVTIETVNGGAWGRD
jgi:hypothetical protein